MRQPQRGLFSVAEVVENADPHLMLGARYQTVRCTTGGEWPICPPDGYAGSKSFPGTYTVAGDGHSAYDGVECAPIGFDDAWTEAALRAAFRPKVELVAELFLYTQLLATEIPSVVDDGELPVVIALGAAETHLAHEYSGQGVIHMNRYTATKAMAHNLLFEPDEHVGTVHTISGTPVVIGRGYGTATALWIGVSGHVSVLLGPMVQIDSPTDRTNKKIKMFEQPFVVLNECVAGHTVGG